MQPLRETILRDEAMRLQQPAGLLVREPRLRAPLNREPTHARQSSAADQFVRPVVPQLQLRADGSGVLRGQFQTHRPREAAEVADARPPMPRRRRPSETAALRATIDGLHHAEDEEVSRVMGNSPGPNEQAGSHAKGVRADVELTRLNGVENMGYVVPAVPPPFHELQVRY